MVRTLLLIVPSFLAFPAAAQQTDCTPSAKTGQQSNGETGVQRGKAGEFLIWDNSNLFQLPRHMYRMRRIRPLVRLFPDRERLPRNYRALSSSDHERKDC